MQSVFTGQMWQPLMSINVKVDVLDTNLLEKLTANPERTQLCVSASRILSNHNEPPVKHCSSLTRQLPQIQVPEPLGLMTEILAELNYADDILTCLGSERIYVWSNNQNPAIALRRILRQKTHEATDIRKYLKVSMADVQTFQDGHVPSYQLSVGFGTYGHHAANNFKVHYWGSRNASLSIGRFTSIAPNVEIFLDGNHCMDCASTWD